MKQWRVMTHPQPNARSSYRRFTSLETRWMNDDAHGHVNEFV
jgi:acyl-CoA thioester hydrolase